jgi:hypothetical protein
LGLSKREYVPAGRYCLWTRRVRIKRIMSIISHLRRSEDPGTKVAENRYLVQWVVELEMSGDYHVNGSFIQTNETIIYDPLRDNINVKGNLYTRKKRHIDEQKF